jgi:hypothetical protein
MPLGDRPFVISITRMKDAAPLLKTVPEVLVGLAPLQIPFAPHSICSFVEVLGVDESPRPAPPSPSTLALLVLAHAPVQIRSEADVESAFRVLQDVDEVHRLRLLTWYGLDAESFRGRRISDPSQEGPALLLEGGSPVRIRTSDLAVNSRPLYR